MHDQRPYTCKGRMYHAQHLTRWHYDLLKPVPLEIPLTPMLQHTPGSKQTLPAPTTSRSSYVLVSRENGVRLRTCPSPARQCQRTLVLHPPLITPYHPHRPHPICLDHPSRETHITTYPTVSYPLITTTPQDLGAKGLTQSLSFFPCGIPISSKVAGP